MSETIVQILSGVGLFFLGVIVGAVFHRSVQGEASKNKRLEQKLSELQARHEKYQADVSKHFMNTAQAVQALNKSYKDVHDQLAIGAGRLCNEEQAQDFLAIGQTQTSPYRQAKTSTVVNDVHTPPMDYAPKQSDSEHGTLSETYGMSKNAQAGIEKDLEIQEPPRI